MQPTTAAWRAFAALAFVFVLTACGGGGGGDGGGGGGGATPTPASGATPTPGSKLFVADGTNHAIGSQINADPSPGSFAIDRLIGGPATGFDPGVAGVLSPSSLALDVQADRLYVATQAMVGVFDQAGVAAGNVAPARAITSTITKMTNGVSSAVNVNFFRLFLDTTNDTLYVAEPDGYLHAFDMARTLNGAVPPSRTIQIDLGASTISESFGIAVDTGSTGRPAANNLFVGVSGSGFAHILIFNAQSTLNIPKAPDQTLSFSTAPTSFYLDSVNDRLYVAVSGDILVFDNANSLTTASHPVARTILLSRVSPSGKFIFVDTTNDRLYAVGDDKLFIIPSPRTADPLTVTQGTLLNANAHFSAVVAKP